MAFPDWFAVITTVPAPRIVALVPTIEITFVLPLVKDTAPLGAVAVRVRVPLGRKVCAGG